ncbi:MAG: succinylglutamate desuccinylase [Lachnospiraceae bacterium]|nr:succinylglutamate desuccinylase [Lachnospiraceae bacterium]
MTIGTVQVQAGEKKSGFLLVEGDTCQIPITVICGGIGPVTLITAGIHNAEYVGIQAAIELSRELQPEGIEGTLILAPLVNVSGFTHRTMSTVWEDGKNLNREFPGNPMGTLAERICYTLERDLFSLADYYLDLHGGDGYEEMCPHVYFVGQGNPQVREKSLHMAQCVEVDYVVESKYTTGGAYNYASSLGIPSILLERGGRGLWSQREVDQDKEDVRRVLDFLYQEDRVVEQEQTLLQETIYENAPITGCWYAYKKAGERFAKGEILGEIRDYFGQSLHICRARADGVVLYQTASLTVLKDGPMVAYGVHTADT